MAENCKRKLNLEMREWKKDCEYSVGFLNVQVFAVSSEKRLLLYTSEPVFQNKSEILRLLRVPYSPCLVYCGVMLFVDNYCNVQHIQQMGVLEFVVLTLDAFF